MAKASRSKRDAASSSSSGEIAYVKEYNRAMKSWKHGKEGGIQELFSPKFDDATRAELFSNMCEIGENLQLKYAWAIPNEEALDIIAHFAKIENGLVEIGSGTGYWAKLLRDKGVDINAYDIKPGDAYTKSTKKKRKLKGGGDNGADVNNDDDVDVKEESAVTVQPSFWTEVLRGGPGALEKKENEGRALLLCYPDDFRLSAESLAYNCLSRFTGNVIIHVGELFGDSLGVSSFGPWGRTTGESFQIQLATEFHCVVKLVLPAWPLSQDHLTVWKRHTICALQFDDDDDDDDGGDSGGSSGGDDEDGGDEEESDNAIKEVGRRRKKENDGDNGGSDCHKEKKKKGDVKKKGKAEKKSHYSNSRNLSEKVKGHDAKDKKMKSSGKAKLETGSGSVDDDNDGDDNGRGGGGGGHGDKEFGHKDGKLGEDEGDEGGDDADDDYDSEDYHYITNMTPPDPIDYYAYVPMDERLPSVRAPCITKLGFRRDDVS